MAASTSATGLVSMACSRWPARQRLASWWLLECRASDAAELAEAHALGVTSGATRRPRVAPAHRPTAVPTHEVHGHRGRCSARPHWTMSPSPVYGDSGQAVEARPRGTSSRRHGRPAVRACSAPPPVGVLVVKPSRASDPYTGERVQRRRRARLAHTLSSGTVTGRLSSRSPTPSRRAPARIFRRPAARASDSSAQRSSQSRPAGRPRWHAGHRHRGDPAAALLHAPRQRSRGPPPVGRHPGMAPGAGIAPTHCRSSRPPETSAPSRGHRPESAGPSGTSGASPPEDHILGRRVEHQPVRLPTQASSSPEASSAASSPTRSRQPTGSAGNPPAHRRARRRVASRSGAVESVSLGGRASAVASSCAPLGFHLPSRARSASGTSARAGWTFGNPGASRKGRRGATTNRAPPTEFGPTRAPPSPQERCSVPNPAASPIPAWARGRTGIHVRPVADLPDAMAGSPSIHACGDRSRQPSSGGAAQFAPPRPGRALDLLAPPRARAFVGATGEFPHLRVAARRRPAATATAGRYGIGQDRMVQPPGRARPATGQARPKRPAGPVDGAARPRQLPSSALRASPSAACSGRSPSWSCGLPFDACPPPELAPATTRRRSTRLQVLLIGLTGLEAFELDGPRPLTVAEPRRPRHQPPLSPDGPLPPSSASRLASRGSAARGIGGRSSLRRRSPRDANAAGIPALP